MLDGDDNVMQRAELESSSCHPSILSTESLYVTGAGQSIILVDNEVQLQSDPQSKFDILEQNHDPGQFRQHNHVPIISTNDESFVHNIHRLPVLNSFDHLVANPLWLSQRSSDLTESPLLDTGSEVGLTQVLGQTSHSSVFDSNQSILHSPDPTSLSHVFDSNPISSVSINSNLINSSDLAAKDPLTGDNTTFECDSCDRTFHHKYKLSRHRRYHTRPHKCPHQGCEYGSTGFVSPKDLARHISVAHSISSQHFCPRSGCKYAERGIGRETGFIRRDNLMRHIRQAGHSD